ncbi:MAG: hypothetical protein IKQ16_08940 [Lentisphaeria bacterium]|nr:hypothetical protein [Lentisphaeria bacterium]
MTERTFTKEEMLNTLIRGIKRFYKEEHHLLEDQVCERAVAFRLGAKLLNKFKPADVYAEYNKRHDPDGMVRKKRLGDLQDTSYPDLLVFERFGDNPRPDKLAIEIKMGYQRNSRSEYENDCRKLAVLTDPYEDNLNYILGIHLVLDVDCFYLCGYELGRLTFIKRFIKEEGKWGQIELSPEFYTSFDDLSHLHVIDASTQE